MVAGPHERGRKVRARLLTGALVALAVAVAPGSVAASRPPAKPPSTATGRLLVLVSRTPARAAAASALIATAGARHAGRQVPEIGLVTVRPARGVSLTALAARLRRVPGVRSVQPEHRFTLRFTPNDPALTAPEPTAGVPAGTTRQWTLAREGFFHAWDLQRGAKTRVAVIDKGVDASHPDLAGKIVVSVDQQDPSLSTGPATTDEAGHGTWVAGQACAATNNALGIAGAGANCKLVVEKSDLTDSSVAASIVDATDRGAQAINMSFGNDEARTPPDAVVAAMDHALARKVILVAAAADSPTTEQGDPANVVQPTGTGADITKGTGLSVTAADIKDHRASFAGSGSQISIAAYGAYDPGSGALIGGGGSGPPGLLGLFPPNLTDFESGFPPCGCRTTFNGDNRYAYLQGTSMAAPQVAAAAALVRTLNPDLSVRDVLTIMKRTARRPARTGWTADLGWGIVNAGGALDSAARTDRRAPRSHLSAPSRSNRRTVTVRFSGRDTGPRGVRVSGVSSFELFARRGSGAVRRVGRTKQHALRVRVRAGARYDWFVVATDRAGNRETRARKAEATTRVSPRAV